MITKRELDLNTSMALMDTYRVKTVQVVTRAFLAAIADALMSEGSVHLKNLGSMRVVVTAEKTSTLTQGTFKKGQQAGKRVVRSRDIKVYFSKSRKLGRLLKEKYDGEVRSRRKRPKGTQ